MHLLVHTCMHISVYVQNMCLYVYPEGVSLSVHTFSMYMCVLCTCVRVRASCVCVCYAQAHIYKHTFSLSLGSLARASATECLITALALTSGQCPSADVYFFVLL